jgi:3-hydroxybutyrate dehydrogenase
MNTMVNLRAVNPLAEKGARSAVSRPLEGRTVLVTGSTRGLGLGIAVALAEAGAMIALQGAGDEAEIENLVHVLGARHDVAVRHDKAELRDPEAVVAMIHRTARALGPVDILVNSAGMQHLAPIASFPASKWDAIIAVNLSAVFHATRAVLPGMKQRGWGRIINIAAPDGSIGSAFKSAYVAARHGVVGLTRVTALETAESGVTCNVVCPGQIRTASAASLPDAPVGLRQRDARAGRLSAADDVAGMVAFLCGPSGASISGATIALDGGWGPP